MKVQKLLLLIKVFRVYLVSLSLAHLGKGRFFDKDYYG